MSEIRDERGRSKKWWLLAMLVLVGGAIFTAWQWKEFDDAIKFPWSTPSITVIPPTQTSGGESVPQQAAATNSAAPRVVGIDTSDCEDDDLTATPPSRNAHGKVVSALHWNPKCVQLRYSDGSQRPLLSQ